MSDLEWSLVLLGDLGSLGGRHEINGMDEQLARTRLDAWQASRPDVDVSLRCRARYQITGEWQTIVGADKSRTLGPNDLLPCGTPTAVKRHRAKAEHCDTCGTEGRRTPSPPLRWAA